MHTICIDRVSHINWHRKVFRGTRSYTDPSNTTL